MKDMMGSMTDRCRKFSMALERGDGQGTKVRPAKKRNLDWNKVIKQMFRGDSEKVRKEAVCRTLTCREPLGHIFHLQTPWVWYCTLVEGQGSAVLQILVQKQQVQWENQVLSLNVRRAVDNHKRRTSPSCCSNRELSTLTAQYQGFPVFVDVPGCENREVLCYTGSQNHTHDNSSGTWNMAPELCRLFIHAARATPLMAMSPYGDILKARLEYSDLSPRQSNTYRALETKIGWSRGAVCGVCSQEMTSVEKNKILNPPGCVCCLQFMQHSGAESTERPGNEQLQTKTDDTTNVSKENPRYLQHEEDAHLSSSYYFATGNQTDAQKSGVHMLYGDKQKHGCSVEGNRQLTATSETLNPTHDAQRMQAISCSSNASSPSGSSDLSVQNIHADCNQNDNKCNAGDNGSNINNEHTESCQNSNNTSNGSRKDLSAGRDENCNKNNNSNEHHLDSDGSSDSEIEYTYEENNDNCRMIGQGPEMSNATPPSGYQTNAENLQKKHGDSLNEYFKQISLDSSANSTHLHMEYNTETSNHIVCESLTLSNNGKTCEGTLYNSMSAMVVPQPGEKLVDVNCESDQEFHIRNANDEFLFVGQAGVETRTELDTQDNTEADHCSSVDISKDTEMSLINSSINEALHMKDENSLIRDSYPSPQAMWYSDIQERIDASATISELSLSQVFDNDFNMVSATGMETFPPSQEDFTENNGTLQASCLDKTVGLEGVTSTETIEPVGMLQGFYEESEILKSWEGSVHIRQTGQCCLEDVKCIHFLNMLTNRLKEYTNKVALISSPESSTTSADEPGQSQSDYSTSDKALVPSAPLTSDHECISFCEDTGRDIYTSPTHAAAYDQQRGSADALTTEKSKEASVECALFEHPKTGFGSENKAHLSPEYTVSSNVGEEDVPVTPTRDIRAQAAEDAPLGALPNCQPAKANDLYELWSTKYIVSLSDEFLHKYDLMTMQAKEKHKKSLDFFKTGMTDLTRNFSYEFADPAFEVDVFRSLEYATSLSCELASEQRPVGLVCEHSNFSGEFHDLVVAQPQENSRNNGGSAYERETVSIKAPESEQTFSVSMSNENALCQIKDEEATGYSRARIMRASERRRKLMTEFEEITSCADVYSWPRYDNRHFCYESGNYCQDFDSPLKRQANHLDSTVQSEGKHRVGTFTIEYLKPPVTGFVVLK